MHNSRSHGAVIRVYDATGNVIETHEHTGVVFLFGSFGVSGWMHPRGLGIATTSFSFIGAFAVFAALRPFLYVVPAP